MCRRSWNFSYCKNEAGVIVLPRSLAFNSNSTVTKSALVLFPSFSNRLEKALNFDTVQSTWLPSWISKMVSSAIPTCMTSQITCKVNELIEYIELLTLRQRISNRFEETVN